jgi:hypothetical protein
MYVCICASVCRYIQRQHAHHASNSTSRPKILCICVLTYSGSTLSPPSVGASNPTARPKTLHICIYVCMHTYIHTYMNTVATRSPPSGGASNSIAQPKVRVRNATFTKGKSEHARPGLSSSNPHGLAGRGVLFSSSRTEDTIQSTGSVGSDKLEMSGVGLTWRLSADRGLPVVEQVCMWVSLCIYVLILSADS